MRLLRPTLAGVLALGVAACTGTISDPGGGEGGGAEPPAEAARFPRLTHTQWDNTVQDLFRLDASPGLASDFQPDPPLGRFDNNIDRLRVTAGHWQDYQRAAEVMAERVTGDPQLLDRILPPEMPAELEPAGRAFVEHFGRRAFRRPLAEEDVGRYLSLFLEGGEHYPEMDPVAAGARVTIEGMLQSPHFLYRVESSTEIVEGAVKLDGYEVANRLSYTFWNTMPSEALFEAAEAGELDTAEGVREWAAQMFDDPRTRNQLEHFHFQAFEMREYADLDKDAELFPDWRRELGEDMQTAAERFLVGEVFGGGGIREILTSTRAYVNQDLAPLYGLEASSFGEEFEAVELDRSRRAGFLTRLGFLTKNATLRQPDPIHRGVFVNLNVICRPLSAVPNLPDDLMPTGDTNRERIDSITGEGTCGERCHGNIINPIGFALENYDAIGQWRSEDNGYPVDAADTYVFEDGRPISFTNGVELSQKLAEAPEVHACYIRQLLEYLYGRDLVEEDQALVSELTSRSIEDGLSVRELVIEVVSSRAFRFRPQDEGVSP